MEEEVMKKLKVMFTEEQLQNRIQELANQIDADYKGKELVVISVLKGAIFFTVDLVKKMKTPLTIEVMQVSSYQGTQSTGNVIIKKGLDSDIAGKDVLIVEDIIDTGYTLQFLKEYLQTLSPNSLKIAVLADKKERREMDVKIDYTGFEVENKFIVGYGFDIDQKYRNIPYIGYIE